MCSLVFLGGNIFLFQNSVFYGHRLNFLNIYDSERLRGGGLKCIGNYLTDSAHPTYYKAINF